MRLLCIGDVVGSRGCAFLRERLPALKRLKGVDAVIANGENSADGNGVTPVSAEHLRTSGVDVVTLGNHAFRRREIYEYLDRSEAVIRPANYPSGTPGSGVAVLDLGRAQIAVVNLIGNVYMGEAFDCPFRTLDRILETPDLPKAVIVDFHAEATGEKRALGYYADGRVTAVVGTHTHVPTADECLLPKGTAYISDLGMTGPVESVLGVKPELVIQKQMQHLPVRFDFADGPCKMDAVLLDLDARTGRAEGIERISIR